MHGPVPKLATLTRASPVLGLVLVLALSTSSSAHYNVVMFWRKLAGLRIHPASASLPIGQASNATFLSTGGVGSKTFSIVSGPGSIDAGTGVYTSALGQRSPNATTQVRVSDANGDTADALVTHARLSVNGIINALVTDGTSVYVGGSFSEAHPNPAFYLGSANAATGALDSWYFSSSLNGYVRAIAVSGSSAYIGGSFTSYQGQTVSNLIKIDIATGALDTNFSRATGPNSVVNAIVVDGSSVYIGGGFTQYRVDNKGYFLAKLDAATGDLDPAFNSTANSGPSGTVEALLVSGDSLYVGGSFTNYRSDTRGMRLAKVDKSTGVLDTAGFNTVNDGPSAVVSALALSGSHLFVGGAFTQYRSDARGYYLAKVDAATGVLETTTFNTVASSGPNNAVYAIAVSGGVAYVGGGFTQYRGDNKGSFLAKIDSSTGAMDTATYNTVSNPLNSTVRSILLNGSDLYLGGDFTYYRGSDKGLRMIKVNASTGVMDTASFNSVSRSGPNGSVYELALSGGSVLFGGDMITYRGTPVQNLAKFDLATWQLDTTFTQSTGPDGTVHALHLAGSHLYVGGYYQNYRGDTKGSFLSKVSTTDGALETTSFHTLANSTPNGEVRAILTSGTDLYLGGNFTRYRNDTRGHGLVKVDASTGVMDTTTFNTTASAGPDGGYVNEIALSGGYLYVGGTFTGYRSDTKGAYLAKVDAATGALETTSFHTVTQGPDADVRAVAISGTSLYIGGGFVNYRGDSKGTRIAKLDLATGAMDTAAFNTVASSGPNSYVESIIVSGGALFVGGIFGSYRGDAKGAKLAKIDPATGALETTTFNTASASISGNVQCVGVSGTTLLVGGNFSSYRGNRNSPYLVPASATSGSEL